MEKETRQITYDFINIINDKLYAKSLYDQSYRHYSNKITDEKYFVDTLGTCKHFKLSKTYKKNNIAILPIQYDRDKDEFNNSKDLIIDNFLVPIVSKLMNIVFNSSFETKFYIIFKSKYFIPILEAEYSRMIKEDLDYNNEKPFIICIESAISSFLTDTEYVNSISDKVLNKLKNSLNNFKFVPVTMAHNGTNIIGNPIKLLDCFDTTFDISLYEQHVIERNERILVNVLNTMADPTKDYYINLKKTNFTLQRVLDYILRMCYIEIIRRYSTLNVIANSSNNVISNIKNELFIYNSRTAKVLKDYLIKFKSNYDHFFSLQTDQSVCSLFTDMLINISSDESHIYCNDMNDKYQMIDPVSTSVAATTKLYSMISTIESMNRDYMKTDSFIIDINALHSVYETISKNMKNIVEIRNKFFNLIYMNPDIFLNKWYPEHITAKSYKKTENFFYHCVNLATMYEKATTISKENIMNHLIEEIRCLYFRDHQFNTNYDTVRYDKENGFDSSKYTNIIEQIFSIIEDLSSNIKSICHLYLENILQDIQHWSGIMENNVSFYQFFDSTNEFQDYNSHILVNKEDFDFYTFDLFERS